MHIFDYGFIYLRGNHMEIGEYGKKSAEIVLIQPVGDHEIDLIPNEIAEIGKRTGKEFMLATFKVNDWNKELSPWKAPAVFGNDDFGDGAEAVLAEILEYCQDNARTYIIGGYSLAGLFSLWAVHRTDRFKAASAVSPSMWFPGFDTFMLENRIRCEKVYLSLGDKEEKARNPVMATVGDRIRAAEALLKERKVDVVLEWNAGNHFREPDVRMAKGFGWVMEQM